MDQAVETKMSKKARIDPDLRQIGMKHTRFELNEIEIPCEDGISELVKGPESAVEKRWLCHGCQIAQVCGFLI